MAYIISSKSYCQILQKSIYQSLGKCESHLSCMVNFQASSIIKNILSESPLNTVFWWRFSYLVTTLLSFTRSSSTKHLPANRVEVKTSYPNWHCRPGIWSLKTWDQSCCRLSGTTIDYIYTCCCYCLCWLWQPEDARHISYIHIHCLSHRHHSHSQFFDRRSIYNSVYSCQLSKHLKIFFPRDLPRTKISQMNWNDII